MSSEGSDLITPPVTDSNRFPLPLVSVVIPTLNRPALLRECVIALCSQNLAYDHFEIVIVDDGSQDPIRQSEILPVNLTETGNHPRIRVIRQENGGPAVARNRGAVEARGALIAFTDDDCRPLPDWLSTLVTGHQQFSRALLGGTTFNGLQDDVFAETSQLIIDMVYDHFNAKANNAVFLTSNNWLCSRRMFLDVGGFDETFRRAGGEDRDFCNRWRATGQPVVWLPDARIEHRHGQSLWGFCNLNYRYGLGAGLFHAKRAQRRSGNAGDDFLFHRYVLRHLPSYLRRYRSMLRRTQIAAALILWEIANAIGFLSATFRSIDER